MKIALFALALLLFVAVASTQDGDVPPEIPKPDDGAPKPPAAAGAGGKDASTNTNSNVISIGGK